MSKLLGFAKYKQIPRQTDSLENKKVHRLSYSIHIVKQCTNIRRPLRQIFTTQEIKR